uniref:Undecaprenyl-phosphate N-acetylglucosaminyl 1-phosphate transferase n=1 Tax=uncultured bacterium contig00077 TaxID=1181555 RepID=A0A806KL06_9BACT|nr:undecaprenyl-phosphate N-acetylglucosaminyl 1-phosphate transferase [uncultured bacterium contig00077]
MAFILIIFAVSTVFSLGAVSLVLKLSHRKKWYDHVDERKIHSGEIPRLGGIGFTFAFLVITSVMSIFFGINGANVLRFLPCVIAMIITLISGLYDDFRPMAARYKIILQLIATVCVIIPGFNFDRLLYTGSGFLSDLAFLSIPVTLLWIIGITNAINLLDGVDGLAGGLSALIAFFLGLIYFSFAGASKSVLFCTCIVGVLVGFLILNAPFPRAKIFMGDCGSQFLGITLAILPLMKETGMTTSLPVLYAAAVFVIPIFDTTAAVWRRIRDGKKIYEPDKSHLHHKLINLGLNARKVILVVYSLQIVVGTLTFLAIRSQGIISLLILGSAYLVALIFFTTVHFLNRAANLKNTPQ